MRTDGCDGDFLFYLWCVVLEMESGASDNSLPLSDTLLPIIK